MNKFVCNYAIARFRPYRETGEFVNVGVVLVCPQTDFFGLALNESWEYKRITDFFPELDFEIFRTALDGLRKELERVIGQKQESRPFVTDAEARDRMAAFKELVRTRESLFHFSEVGTVLAEAPKIKLAELFDLYVKRRPQGSRNHSEPVVG